MSPPLVRLPELRASGPDDHLAIYLRDHLAASAGGLALTRRSLANNRGTDHEPALRQLHAETLLDREALERVADHLGVPASRIKHGAAWVVEKAGRAKANGHAWRYSTLARLWEFEQLGSAVRAKTDLWILLAEDLAHHVPPDVDADEVRARCRSHVDLVEEHRRQAALAAFPTDRS